MSPEESTLQSLSKQSPSYLMSSEQSTLRNLSKQSPSEIISSEESTLQSLSKQSPSYLMSSEQSSFQNLFKQSPSDIMSPEQSTLQSLSKQSPSYLMSSFRNLSKQSPPNVDNKHWHRLHRRRIPMTSDGASSRRPNDSRFIQQELPAWRPILTPGSAISVYLLVSVIFIPLGVVMLLASNKVVEIVDWYDTECIPESSRANPVQYIQTPGDKTCNRTIIVPRNMTHPVYVYYELHNFFQNHKRYIRSRSDIQLKSPSGENETKHCYPIPDKDSRVIVPCGLIAWSLFNDTYSFTRNNSKIDVNKTGISWASDREKFGKDVYPKNFQNGTLIGGGSLDPNIPLYDQEDLIVWMRTAALPTFRKLYGRIETDLYQGDEIQVSVKNNYNTYSFNGKKKLVLSTSSWLGGNSNFLGIAYLSVGGLCFFLAMVFSVMYLIKPRRLGDPSFLSWNRTPGGR